MKFIDSISIKLFTKEQTEIEFTGGVIIKFPEKFRVKQNNGVAQIFDPKDKHFLLQFSVMTDQLNREFNIEDELIVIKKDNPNAEIQFTGKYKCICSATKNEDSKEIIYKWIIGYKTKLILVTLLIFNLKERDEIDKRIFLASEFLKGIEIKN